MIRRLQALPPTQRQWAFLGLLSGVVVVFLALAVLVMVLIARSSPRLNPAALQANVRVAEFARLSDPQAYPAALAIGPQGEAIYTGSYVHGAVWRIDPQTGEADELVGSRASVGSVTALAAQPDGLYVLDRVDPLEARGFIVWRWTAGGGWERWIDYEGRDEVLLPDDLAFDGQGRAYISDRGRDAVWRFPDEAIWWRSPQVEGAQAYAPTGLAYLPDRDALLIGDSLLDVIYEVDVEAADPIAQTRVLYDRRASGGPPLGLDGLTVDGRGRIVVAALATNQILALNPTDGTLTAWAGNYRGSSDVAYDVQRGRFIVANWDQRSLLPLPVLFFQVSIDPHLPFSLDTLIVEDSP
jgi:sugar lactone lactonase YvrE